MPGCTKEKPLGNILCVCRKLQVWVENVFLLAKLFWVKTLQHV